MNEQRDDILDFLSAYINVHGYSPSMREIAEAIGRSVSTVYYHMQLLEKWGLVTHQPRKARSYRVKDAD